MPSKPLPPKTANPLWYAWCYDAGTVPIAGFWITKRHAFLPMAPFLGYIGSCTDITERRRAEEALRESEQEMSLAASAAKLAMWTWDIWRDEVWTMDEGRALFGFAQSEKLNFARFLNALYLLGLRPISANLTQRQGGAVTH